MSEFKNKLEQIRKKLLDLTRRNKLINYRKPTKSRYLKIIDESPEFIYNQLVFEEQIFKFKFIPEPEIPKLIHEKLESKKVKIEKVKQSTLFDGEKKAAETQIQKIFEEMQDNQVDALLTAEEQAKKLGFNIDNELPDVDLTKNSVDKKYVDDYLQTLHYPTDLEKILKKIELSARSVIQETGTNMLYLILGILEWKESNNSDIKIKSPLISIPVSLERGSLNKKTNTYEYKLEFTGESIDTNKSLAEKLKNNFSIILPELTEDYTFNEYMTEVKKICSNKSDWKIKQEITLDFLQFSKILMYKDLNPDEWGEGELEKHNILNDLFMGRDSSSANSYAPEEYDIDHHPVADRIPLVLDADSSQHSAIVDVLDGKNVVIEGPPGTGKSQTISNMIASLMNEGKSVLFVSEKLAALEVVHKRLSNIGLGDFCLELHSHKTQKTKILESLKKRIEGNYKTPSELKRVKKELELKKKELKEYLDTIHLSHGKTEKKIFEIFWQVEKYNKVSEFLKFEIKTSEEFDITDINSRIEDLHRYQSFMKENDFINSFWYGFNLDQLDFIDIGVFIKNLANLNSSIKMIDYGYKKLEILSSNNINFFIPSQINELKEITLFLQSIDIKHNHNVNIEQRLLGLLKKETIVLLENYIRLAQYNQNKKIENQNKIIDYESLNEKDIHFLVGLDDNQKFKLKEYVCSKQKLVSIGNLLKDTIYIDSTFYSHNIKLDNNLSSSLTIIEQFLYSNISISSIEKFSLMSENLLSSLSKLKK